MSMRTNLLMAAAVGLVVAIVVGIVGIPRMNVIADRADVIYAKSLMPIAAVNDIQQVIWHARLASCPAPPPTDADKAKAYTARPSRAADPGDRRDHLLRSALDVTAGREGRDGPACRRPGSSTCSTGSRRRPEEGRQDRRVARLPGAEAEPDHRAGRRLHRAAQEDLAGTTPPPRRPPPSRRPTTPGPPSSSRWSLGILLAGAIALLSARVLARRLSSLAEVMAAMAAGDLRDRGARLRRRRDRPDVPLGDRSGRPHAIGDADAGRRQFRSDPALRRHAGGQPQPGRRRRADVQPGQLDRPGAPRR